MLAKITALIVHEAHARLIAPVVAEYQKIGEQPVCALRHAGEQTYDVASTTGCQAERAPQHDHDTRPAVGSGSARPFGFGRG